MPIKQIPLSHLIGRDEMGPNALLIAHLKAQVESIRRKAEPSEEWLHKI
jgi:hypothetical protein